MHKNPIWLTFLVIIALIVAWYVGVAFYRMYDFYTLQATAPATITQWSAKEIATDEFAPYAKYSFVVHEKHFEGETALKYPIFRNSWAVEQSIPQLESKKWTAWYSPSNPNHSSIQKKFPTKECVSAALLFGLLLYFVWLGFYVAKKQ